MRRIARSCVPPKRWSRHWRPCEKQTQKKSSPTEQLVCLSQKWLRTKVRPLSSWSADMQPHIDNSQGCTPDKFVMTVITKTVDMYPNKVTRLARKRWQKHDHFCFQENKFQFSGKKGFVHSGLAPPSAAAYNLTFREL